MTFPEAVTEALKHPKYSQLLDKRDRFMQDLFEQLLKWLYDLLSGININIDDTDFQWNNYDSNVLFTIAIILIAIIVIVALIIIIFAIRRRKRKKRYTDGMEEMFDSLDNQSISTLDLMKQSDLFASSGDYRSAVRYRYICLLWVMSKRVLSISPSKVNSRIVNEVETRFKDKFNGFKNIVYIYDYAWFGEKKLAPEEYASFSEVFDSVLKEASAYEEV